MDPVAIALSRRALPQPGHEQIVCDVSIMPWAQSLYGGMAAQFLEATRESVNPPEGSLLHASVSLMSAPVFVGIGDLPPEPLVLFRNGSLEPAPALKKLVVEAKSDTNIESFFLRIPLIYAGVSDLELLLKGFTSVLHNQEPSDGQVRAIVEQFDHSQLLDVGAGNIQPWIRRWRDGLVSALRRDALEQVIPQLETSTSERPAQIRLALADLEGTRWGELARVALFSQARQLSAANPRLLHQLMQQLHLEGDEARPLAEELLRGKMVCPLGGKYVMVSRPDQPARWVSTAWSHANLVDENAVPGHYAAPFLHWYHGLAVETTLGMDTLTVHFELTANTGENLIESQARAEADARQALTRVLEEPQADRRQSAFHEWVGRFQKTAIVEKSRELLPELWRRREEEARLRLAALGQPATEADLVGILAEFPLMDAAPGVQKMLRERRAVSDWEQLAPILPAQHDRARLILEFAAKHHGTEAARKAQPALEKHRAQEQASEHEASRKLQAIRARYPVGYPEGLQALIDEYPNTATASEAKNWETQLTATAMVDLRSFDGDKRANALKYLVESGAAVEANVDQLTFLLLHDPNSNSRRDAAILINRLGEPAWDRAARAVQTALRTPAKAHFGEAEAILGVTRKTRIKQSERSRR